jgi:hypothetical protein
MRLSKCPKAVNNSYANHLTDSRGHVAGRSLCDVLGTVYLDCVRERDSWYLCLPCKYGTLVLSQRPVIVITYHWAMDHIRSPPVDLSWSSRLLNEEEPIVARDAWPSHLSRTAFSS